MANNKLFVIKSAYILLLALIVSAVCLPVAVSADIEKPVIVYEVSPIKIYSGSYGTVTVTLSETGGQVSAKDIYITLSTDIQGVSFEEYYLSELKAGSKQIIDIPVFTSVSNPPSIGTYNGIINLDYSLENGEKASSSDFFRYTLIKEPVIEFQVSNAEVVSGGSGTATVTVVEIGGQADAKNIYVTLSTDIKGISFGDSQPISALNRGERQTLKIPMYADSSVKAGTYNGNIKITYNAVEEIGDEVTTINADGRFSYTVIGESVIQHLITIPKIVAGESGTATVTVSETGQQNSAENVLITLSTDTQGVSFGSPQTISKLNSAGSNTLTFPIYTDSSVKPGTYIGKIDIDYNGQSTSDSFQYTIIGTPKIRYQISVSDVVLGKSGTATVIVSETSKVSPAQNVAVTLSSDSPGISFGVTKTISQLDAGESKTLTFPINIDSSVEAGSYSGVVFVNNDGQNVGTSNFMFKIIGDPGIKSEVFTSEVVSGDTGTVTVVVSETSGVSPAQNVVITLSTDAPGISFGGPQTISRLNRGGVETVTFPIYTTSSVRPGTYIGKAQVDCNGNSIIDTFQIIVTAPSIGESVSRIASGKSPLSPITIIIACIVTAFVAVYTGSRRDRK